MHPLDPSHTNAPPLVFGVFPGLMGTEEGLTGSETYDPARIEEALARLQPAERPFLIRGYVLYKGNGRGEDTTPADARQFVHSGRRLDYVLCYCSLDGDVADWTEFVCDAVRRFGPDLGALQITEEPNSTGGGGNGGFPNVRRALVEGVLAARDEAQRQGLAIPIGFSATPSFNPNDNFWPEIAALGGPSFVEALDYVGLDFFPDVFRPIAPDDLRPSVEAVLTHFRTVNLATGGIPATVPIRITENGWPTGPNRPPERQAEVLETVVRTVHELRGARNITHYEFFALRDAQSENPNALNQFGLLWDDYTPKPAFDAYRRLIAELGAESLRT